MLHCLSEEVYSFPSSPSRQNTGVKYSICRSALARIFLYFLKHDVEQSDPILPVADHQPRFCRTSPLVLVDQQGRCGRACMQTSPGEGWYRDKVGIAYRNARCGRQQIATSGIVIVYQPPPDEALEFLYIDDHLLVALTSHPACFRYPDEARAWTTALVSRVQKRVPDALTVHRLDMDTFGSVAVGAGGRDTPAAFPAVSGPAGGQTLSGGCRWPP